MARVVCPEPGVQLTLMDYPLTDMRTGDTAHAVWEGERDPRNPQRLIRPRLVGVFKVRPHDPCPGREREDLAGNRYVETRTTYSLDGDLKP